MTALAVALTGQILKGQTLARRDTPSGSCPPAHLRVTARAKDGTPVSDLVASDFQVRFSLGPATILAAENGSPKKPPVPLTQILFVVPPYAHLSDAVYGPLLRRLARADNFHLQMAVLGPEGSVSLFTDDFLRTGLALRDASETTRIVSRNDWIQKEQLAFNLLRKLPGRHIVFRLRVHDRDHLSVAERNFFQDTTLEQLTRFDGAQLYQLIEPMDVRLAIPSGDAAESHSADQLAADGRIDQQVHLQEAREQQELVWMKRRLGTATGGRAESSVERLADDLLEDAAGDI
jgi:hypothetical protein